MASSNLRVHADVTWRGFALKTWYSTPRSVNLSNSTGDSCRIQLKVDYSGNKPPKYSARIWDTNVECTSQNMDSAEEALEDARVRLTMLASTLLEKDTQPHVEQTQSLEDPMAR